MSGSRRACWQLAGLVCAVAAVCLAGTAEAPVSPGPGEPKEAKPEKPPVFHLRDGGQIAGQPQIESLQVETSYGRLVIPRNELVEVRFALRVQPELKAKIEAALARLAAEDFDEREAATEELEAVGQPAIPFLKEALKSPVEEVKSRAAEILKAIESRQDKSSPAQSAATSEDEIVSTRMTVKGRVLQEQFEVQTAFGKLTVAATDIAMLQFGAVKQIRAKVTVTAQNQAPGKWLDTKIDLTKDQTLRISASGQISVRNYGIVSGPAGNTEWSGHGSFANLPMLSLVGKIGKNGKPFLVGASYRGRCIADGRLYLAVVPFSPYPSGASGAYQARIQTE